ncbi:MAG TPA: DNA alkylation repair protein [Trebonia sp.]
MPTAEELVSVACVRELAELLTAAAPERPWSAAAGVADTLPPLGLSDRVRAVRDALLADLPDDYPGTEAIVLRALGKPAFTGWLIWPVTEAVASRALANGQPGAFEAGLELLAKLTTRLTGEFALRTFLLADLDRTLATARTWISSPDENVRRLASEGTRPRLPWARKVPALFDRPGATQAILDALHEDPSEYVRRSVANHLNDVSRIDPALAVATARRWTADAGAVPPVVRHGLRTLIKQADPGALRLLGFGPTDALAVDGPRLAAGTVAPGRTLEFSFTVTNTGPVSVRAAIDYVVHYRKANGTLAPRVYKLTTRTFTPGESYTATRAQSFRPVTTRRHYPGEHALELQVNGTRHGYARFALTGAESF